MLSTGRPVLSTIFLKNYWLKVALLINNWYELNGRFADIHVDGQLEGPDGNLQQSGTITFKYHRFLFFPWD